MFNAGYVGIINGLVGSGAAALDVRLGRTVTAVDYRTSTVSVTHRDSSKPNEAGQALTARYVISTLPLGVLQARSVSWNPSLPQWKTTAINSLVRIQSLPATLLRPRSFGSPPLPLIPKPRRYLSHLSHHHLSFLQGMGTLNRLVLFYDTNWWDPSASTSWYYR